MLIRAPAGAVRRPRVHVPRQVAASGDYTQWYVVRDHDNLVYHVRSYDSWHTDSHDLASLGVTDSTSLRRSLPLPATPLSSRSSPKEHHR